MDGNNTGLNRLCQIYEELDERERGEIIRLAEGLLNSQSEKMEIVVKTESAELNK